MSKIKRTDKQTPPLGKKTKIFDLAPTGVYGKFKAKDFKGIKHLIKKGHKVGGVIKAESGTIVTPRMSRYVSDTLKSADEGAYRIGSKLKEKGKGILSKVKEKISRAGEIMRKGPSAVTPTKAGALPTKAGSLSLAKLDKAIGDVRGKTKKLGAFKTARNVAKFARLATPIGAATVVATSIKKRDPKAVKRERDFYKGKKYKDVGFESMMDYAKPKSKGGVISYNKGGFNYAINRKR